MLDYIVPLCSWSGGLCLVTSDSRCERCCERTARCRLVRLHDHDRAGAELVRSFAGADTEGESMQLLSDSFERFGNDEPFRINEVHVIKELLKYTLFLLALQAFEDSCGSLNVREQGEP
jgi:hypothetical protein